MRLVSLPNGWEIDPEDVSAIRFDEPTPKLEVRLSSTVPGAYLVFLGPDAISALAAIRKHQAPEPEAVARTMTGLEDICRRVAALERMMEMLDQDTPDADDHDALKDRVDAIGRRLADVEAHAFKSGDDEDFASLVRTIGRATEQFHAAKEREPAEEPPARSDGFDPAAARAMAERIVDGLWSSHQWPSRTEDFDAIAAMIKDKIAPRAARVEWVARCLTEFAAACEPDHPDDDPTWLLLNLLAVIHRDDGQHAERCGLKESTRLAIAWVHAVRTPLDEPAACEPDGPKDHRDVAGGHWHLRTPPMPVRVEIAPDVPRRFRWPKTDGGNDWGYGVYFPSVRMTCTETSTWLDARPSRIFKGIQWLDPEPEPDGSRDRADIVAPPGWTRESWGTLKRRAGDRWWYVCGNKIGDYMVVEPSGRHHIGRVTEADAVDYADRLIAEQAAAVSEDRADIVGIGHFNGPVS